MVTLHEIRQIVYFTIMVRHENIVCHKCIVKACCSKLCKNFTETFVRTDYETRKLLKKFPALIPGKMFWNHAYKKLMLKKLSVK